MAATRAIALCQLIAARKGVQAEVHSNITGLHHNSQKTALLSGFAKTYRKLDDADADLPSEGQKLQVRLTDVLAEVRRQYTRTWDLTASIDETNRHARADVVVDGQTLIPAAPTSFLLYLEKQLTDLHTMIAKLPVLDPAETWRWDGNVGAYVTERTSTLRQKKVLRSHVLYEATDEHPAQVQPYHEDVPVGYWDTIKFSGAIPADRKTQLLERVSAVRQAVKMAREQANMTEAIQVKAASALFDHILAE